MITVVAAIFVLSLLILVHEWGHFLAARLFGVKVKRFSVGFGPRIWGIQKGDTDFCVSAIPLGGYVKLLGEEEEALSPSEKPYAFSEKPLWQRMAIVFAGPLFNFLLAWLIFSLFFLSKGKPHLLPEVGKVMSGTPAEKAGLKAGDLILEINGVAVKSWEELTREVRRSAGKNLKLKVKRDGKTVVLTVVPEIREVKNIFGETERVPVLGIIASGNFYTESLPPWRALWEGWLKMVSVTKLTFTALVKLIERVLPLSTIGGPLLIAQMAGEQAKQGFMALLLFAGVLSVNLGILNLLPIPMLDGGHLFFYTIEAVRGRPLAPQTQERLQKVGLALLIAIMALAFYNDLLRILSRWIPPLTPH